MIVRFRIPFWYKFMLVVLWVVSFDLTIFLLYKPLHPSLKWPILILDIIFGVWILSVYRKEIVIDQTDDGLLINGKGYRLSNVDRVERKNLSIIFYFKDGTFVFFPHPIEDFEFLEKLIREKGSG
ncbi:hypothetical protein AS005_04435 [Thermotoga sp. KOL6]|nr:hypothetical protein AS005_04435 [Thermotoga sp. KOL6]